MSTYAILDFMLNDDFREARIEAGLSQSELARRAGVPRRQIQLIENGANVTIDTLRRVAPALPNLKRLHLGGGIEIATGSPNLDEVRRAALDLFDHVKRLVAALGEVSATPSSAPTPREVPSTRAVTTETATVSDLRKARELEEMIQKGKHKRRRADA
jgi:transcriptional regulator with XRE-family HTH domain